MNHLEETCGAVLLVGAALLACGNGSGPQGAGTAGGGLPSDYAPTTSEAGDGGGGRSGAAPDASAGQVSPDAGTPELPAGCPSRALKRVLPSLVLLIDQSGSMAVDLESLSRWDTMVQVLTSPESLLRSRQHELRLGAVAYTSDAGFGTNPESVRECPRYAETQVAADNYGGLAVLLGAEGPEGDSPGAEAISAVAQQLAAATDLAPVSLLWITDGNTDTCEDPVLSDEPTSTALSVQALSAAFALGISTQIISLGTQTPPASLQAMARAGAGGDASAVGHQVTTAAELAAALSATVQRVHSCVFEAAASISDSTAVSVKLNGTELQLGSADGWEQTSSGLLELRGKACAASLSAEAALTLAERVCP